MFESSEKPRVFGLPPGCDFAKELVAGILDRSAGMPPEALARAEIFLNTRANERRVRDEFVSRGPLLLPRMRLVAQLADDRSFPDIRGPASKLRRRLELAQAVGVLLEGDERFGSRGAAFDLAGSLTSLMDEMNGEGVSPEALHGLDVSAHSAHWQRSLEFINLIERHWGADAIPDAEARRRKVAERLAEAWAASPPTDPVIVAGSTGSRGATRLLMKAVARLPQGAVILPCFDFDLPRDAWDDLQESKSGENHPQYRMKQVLQELDLDPSDVAVWRDAEVACPARNRMVSLALRPAPVTDQWMQEGPALEGISDGTAGVSLIEAPTPQLEAAAIAMRLRKAAEDGQSIALVTPDRLLVRQVKASLERWSLVPYDGSGEAIGHTSAGRFLRIVARLRWESLTPGALIALLSHPVASSGKGRGRHLRWTRRLDQALRRDGTGADILEFIRKLGRREDAPKKFSAWTGWVADMMERLPSRETEDLGDHIRHHVAVAEAFSSGVGGKRPGRLWKEAEGRAAKEMLNELKEESAAGGRMDAATYARMFESLAAAEDGVREPYAAHPGIMVLSTIDARMRNPDIAVIGGLNEGTWPRHAPPDPWLNRTMRRDAGLLSPERRIGLTAHDFQQAVAAREVCLTRSMHDGEAPTLPSRWLSRISGLLGGLGETGTAALADMRARGRHWLGIAEAPDAPQSVVEPALRPCPAPPTEERPRTLSVTEISTLVTDPYAIYAKHVLRLWPMRRLNRAADAIERGVATHLVMEEFVGLSMADEEPDIEELAGIAERVFGGCGVPDHIGRLWLENFRSGAEQLMRDEKFRLKRGTPILLERKGEVTVPELDFTLIGKADRIDRDESGRFYVYDYKTGAPPSKKQVRYWDKQMPLQAAMLERSAFGVDVGGKASEAYYVRVGRMPAEQPVFAWLTDEGDDPDPVETTWRRFLVLMSHYRDPEFGYVSRRFRARNTYGGDYDHLARFGEWNESERPEVVAVE